MQHIQKLHLLTFLGKYFLKTTDYNKVNAQHTTKPLKKCANSGIKTMATFTLMVKTFLFITYQKGPFRSLLAPPEGLRAPGLPVVNLGVDFRCQGVISRRFKRKKNFVTDRHTHRQTDGQRDVLVEIVMQIGLQKVSNHFSQVNYFRGDLCFVKLSNKYLRIDFGLCITW